MSDKSRFTRRNLLIATSATVVGGGALGAVKFADAARETQDCGEWVEGPDEYPEVNIVNKAPDAQFVPEDAEEVIFHIHGWNSKDMSIDQAYALDRAMAQNEYDVPVIAVTWDANTTWSGPEHADEAASRFADWLLDYAARFPTTTLRVVGHSLGGRVAYELLTLLDGDLTIETVVPVAAGVTTDTVCEDGRYAAGIRQSADVVYNYYSRNDAIVEDFFSSTTRGDGLGSNEAECSTPENYTDVDVTDAVESHCDYLRPDVGCVPSIIRQFE